MSLASSEWLVTRNSGACGDSIVTMALDVASCGAIHDGEAAVFVIARVKTGQGFDEWVALFAVFSIGFFDRTRCAGLAGFGRGWF